MGLSTRVPAYQSTSVLAYQLSSLHFQSDQDQYQQASTGFYARNPALLLQAWKENILEYLNQSTSVPSSKLPGSSTRDWTSSNPSQRDGSQKLPCFSTLSHQS